MTRAQDIDAAMNAIDDACLAGDFDTAKAAILATRDGPIAVGLAALIIARAWSATLWKERAAVADSIRERAPDRVAGLLRGLIE